MLCVAHAGYEKLLLPGENEWVVIMPADDPMAKLDAVRPEDLAGKEITCSRLALKSGLVDEWFGEHEAKVGATFNLGTYLITVLAANGVGYCLTYESLHGIVGDPRVVVRPLDPPIPVDRSIVSWKRGRALSPACRAFLEVIREACDESRPL